MIFKIERKVHNCLNQTVMQIDPNILVAWGASIKKINKGQFVFHEGDDARCYFQIMTGQVKMYNINDEGKEFIQGFFSDGESFGEPPLFIDEHYPSFAIATKETIVLKLSKDVFFKILDEYKEIEDGFLKTFAQRIFDKANSAKDVVNNIPEQRIIGFLSNFKKKSCSIDQRIQIPFTRQEIANFTGLRVETVIRTLSKMKERKQVDIIERKLYF